MFLMSNHISSTNLPQFDTQIAALNTLNAINQSLTEDFDRCWQLQVETVEQSLETFAATVQEFFSVKDPQELFVLLSAQAQPNYEQIMHYFNCLSAVGTHSQNKFNELFKTLATTSAVESVQLETAVVTTPVFQHIVAQHADAQQHSTGAATSKGAATNKRKSAQPRLTEVVDVEAIEVDPPKTAGKRATARRTA